MNGLGIFFLAVTGTFLSSCGQESKPTSPTSENQSAVERYASINVQIDQLIKERKTLEPDIFGKAIEPYNGNVACAQSEQGVGILCGGGSEVGGGREGPNPKDNDEKEKADKAKAEQERAARERSSKVEAARQFTEHYVRELEKSSAPEAKVEIIRARERQEVCNSGGACIND